jgi:hypothetical protein
MVGYADIYARDMLDHVGSRTRDRGEAGIALVTKAMSHQGKTYARAARVGVGFVKESRSLLHLTSKG